ncbi:uncharacterized protein METZ01_LOCUS215389, partial [marine metagenome]
FWILPGPCRSAWLVCYECFLILDRFTISEHLGKSP